MSNRDLKSGWEGTLLLVLMILLAIVLWPFERNKKDPK